jgi:ClpP class serine protease
VTDGRVFSGQRAVELGLADQAGTLDEAIDAAASAVKLEKPRVIMYKRPYGYEGSIYAAAWDRGPRQQQQRQANVIQLNVPALQEVLPTGFYYLWRP